MTLAIRNQRSRLGLKDADREQKEQEAMSTYDDGNSEQVLISEIRRLRALNAELVSALELLLTPNGPVDADDVERWMRDSEEHMDNANAVLAKAKGEKP